MKAMEQKAVTVLLDAGSAMAFFFGWFSGQDVLMLLGAMASIAAILNHGSQWLGRRKNKNKK